MSYTGPPPSTRPPPDWRPRVVREPAPPRRLPSQDHAALDVAERAARQLTWVVGVLALVVAVVVAAAALVVHQW